MAYADSDWAANREDRRPVSGGMLVHNGRTLEILVKKARGGVAFVVVSCTLRCQLDQKLSDFEVGSEASGTTRV